MPWNENVDEFDSNATTEKEEQTPETIPRAWWLSSQDRTIYRSTSEFSPTYSMPSCQTLFDDCLYEEFDETIQYLHDYLVKEPHFDVSQTYFRDQAELNEDTID